jgi:hypothetical protein
MLPLWALVGAIGGFVWFAATWRLAITLEDRIFLRRYVAEGHSLSGPLYDERRRVRSFGQRGTPLMAKRYLALSQPLPDPELERRRQIARRIRPAWPAVAIAGFMAIAFASLTFLR